MNDILPPCTLLSAHCTPNTSSAGYTAWMPLVSRATSPGVEGGKHGWAELISLRTRVSEADEQPSDAGTQLDGANGGGGEMASS